MIMYIRKSLLNATLLKLVKIKVSHNGIGIASGNSEKILNTFERLRYRDHYVGTRLRLSFCMKIVQRNGGEIRNIQSEVSGAVFEVILPKTIDGQI